MRLLVLAFFVVLSGVAVCGPVSTPERGARGLEAPGEREGFAFAVFGDRVPGSDGGLEILARAVETVNRLGVRFVLTTGNMIQGDSRRDDWVSRADAYRSVMSGLSMPWYPVRGPLDADVVGLSGAESDGLYADRFGPSTYSFDAGWSHVVVLPGAEIAARGESRGRVLSWLKSDLASAAGAEQVFVAVHEPVWRTDADAWEAVQALLEADGRPTRVISGGTGYSREDRQRENVRYSSVSVTGAFSSDTHEYASDQVVTLVHVHRLGHSVTVLPFDAVSSGDAYVAKDAEAVRALSESGWASIEGFLQAGAEAGDGAAFEVVLENPTDARLGYSVETIAPAGWVLSRDRVSGNLDAGQTLRLPVRADAPALRGQRPVVEVMVTARYLVAGGNEQPIVRRLAVPVRPRGAEGVSGARPGANGVLSLDGRGAVRVDLGERPRRLTLEAWVRGPSPTGNASVASGFVKGAGFGIDWSRARGTLPSAAVGTDRGVLRVGLDEPIAWDAWHHFALTYDGSDAVLFVDGREVSRRGGGSLLFGEGPFYIGASPTGRGDAESQFIGEIDEVRVSSVVRYTGAFEPASVHRTDGDTLLLMHFDTPYFGAHPDDSGRGHHGWDSGGAEVIRAER